MLSAVENLVPGRVYSHPFSGPSAPSLLSQLPIPRLPLLSNYDSTWTNGREIETNGREIRSNGREIEISVAEFARPHPKQRYPDTLRNGLLTSSRPKYSDQQQNGPVNLAVSTPSLQSSHVKTNHLLPDSFHGSSLQQKDSELSKLYSQNPRLSFFSSPALEANTYPALNYSLYPFGSPGLYSSSHYPRSTYIPPTQRDAYNASAYLPPVSFGSPVETSTSGSSNLASNKSKISPLSSSIHSHMNGQLSGHNGIVGPTSVSQDKHEVPIKSIHNSFIDRPYPNGGTTVNGMTAEQHHQLLHAAYSSFAKEKENKEKLLQAQSHIEHNNNNNIKTNNNNTSNGNSNSHNNSNDKGFKIPSGKEGSLKHRILTRPYGTDRDGRRKSPTVKTTTTVFKSTDNGTTTTNFTKGSLIELANGEFRRVEDVRTEDFVQLAEKSSELQLTESTTVKITPKYNHLVVIAVSFDNNKSKVDIETSIEYPFFVYGQGWASCSPEKTYQLFGLKCQQLRVGDICLLLRPRDVARKASQSQQPPAPAPHPLPPQLPPPPSFQQMYDQSVPQNLSRRSSHSIFTTASSSRPAPTSLPPPAPIFSIPYKDHMHHPHLHHHHHNHHQQQRSLAPPQSSNASSMNDNDQPVALMVVNKSSTSTTLSTSSSSSSTCNDDSLDSSISRKRRWSAPADQDL